MNPIIPCAAVACALLLTGCASPTTPPSPSELRPAAADRIYPLRSTSSHVTSLGRLVVVRDVGFGGSGCFYAVSVDGQLAARLDVGERVELAVPVGERVLRAHRDPMGRGLCGLQSNNWSQLETVVIEGKVKTFRLTLHTDGVPLLQRGD